MPKSRYGYAHRTLLLQDTPRLKSKGKGKSGGARVITYYYIHGETVYLLSIYDKTEQENIAEEKIAELLLGIQKPG